MQEANMVQGTGEAVERLLLRDMTQDQQARFLEHFERSDVSAGTDIVSEGDSADSIYVIWSGACAVFKAGGSTQVSPTLVNHLSEGAVIGEMTFFRGGAYSATVKAITPCVILRMPHRELRQMAAQEPELGAIVLRKLILLLASKLESILEDISSPGYLSSIGVQVVQALALATQSVRDATVEREDALRTISGAMRTLTGKTP